MADELLEQINNEEEPKEIQRPTQFPTATRVEDGIAYDITGKALGPVNMEQAAQEVQAAQVLRQQEQIQDDDFFTSLGGVVVQADDSAFTSLGGVAVPQQSKEDDFFLGLGGQIVKEDPLRAAGKATAISADPSRIRAVTNWIRNLTDEREPFPQWLQTGLEKAYEYGIEPFEKITEMGQQAGALMFELEGERLLSDIPFQPQTRLSPEGKGILRGLGKFVGGAASDPRNWPFLGSGAARPLLQKLISGGFSALMTEGAIERANALSENWDKLTPEQRAEELTQLTGETVFAATATAHALRPTKPPRFERGARVVDEKLRETLRTEFQTFEAATKTYENSQLMFERRMQELDVATKQVEQAARDVELARQNEAAGIGTREQTIDAENIASEASANSKKAMDAVKQAGESRAEAGIQRDRLNRQIERSQAKGTTEKETREIAGAQEDFQKAIPSPASGPARYDARDYQIGRRYLERHRANVQDIETVQDAYDAFDYIQHEMENAVQPYTRKYARESLTTNVTMDVRDALSESPRADFVERGMRELEQYNLIDPTIAEAESIRVDLNAQNRATLKRNMWDVATALKVDPEFAARYYAAESLRNGIYGRFEEKGIAGIRELRQDEASIIRLRNAAERQLARGGVHVRGSGESGRLRRAAAWVAQKGTTALGAKIGGPKGSVLGQIAGERLGQMIAPGDLTRDQLVARSLRIEGGGVPITEIEGPGRPSVPPPFEIPSGLRADVIPPKDYTPLHGELASHYGESVGKSTYAELERRFMEDIGDKQTYGVPLDAPEKTLLNKINQQIAADATALLKEIQKQAIEGKVVIREATLPDKAEPLLRVPQAQLGPGMDTQTGLVHDLAHVIVGTERGLEFADGIRSHHHPENKKAGSLMSAPINWAEFIDAEGRIDFNKMKARMPDIAAAYVAGGVANDLYHGIPFTENHNLGADFRLLKRFMKEAGFSELEASKLIAQAADDAAAILSRENVQTILEGHASVREGGLKETHHVSQERMQQILQDIKGEAYEPTTRKPTETVGAGARGVEKPGAAAKGTDKERDTELVRQESERVTERAKEDVGKPEPDESSPKLSRVELKEQEAELARQYARTRPITGPSNKIESLEQNMLGYMRPDKTVAQSHRESAFDTHDTLSEHFKENIETSIAEPGWVKYGTGSKGGSFITIGNSDPLTIKNAIEVAERLPVNNVLFEYYPTVETEAGRPPISFDGTPKEIIGKIQRQFTGPQIFEIGEEVSPKLSPPERTTGIPEHDEVIRKAGAIPGGIFKGDPSIGVPELTMFHDPTSGTTLALKTAEGITPEKIQAKLTESRAAYKTADVKRMPVAEAADEFNVQKGRTKIDAEMKPHSPEFARRVADAYDQMKHEPDNPRVKTAYDALTQDVREQWDYATQKMGIIFEPWTKEGQPYANSKEMIQDVKNNKHLYFFQGGEMLTNHPLAKIDPQTNLSYNDMFRAVHDLFGHAANEFQFGPRGEENAYLVHRQMFSPEAVPALTTETRGQNSWVNYGKQLRTAEGKIPEKGQEGYISPSERPYAENKAGLLPDEFIGQNPFVVDLEQQPSGAMNPLSGSTESKRYGVEIYPERRQVLDHSPTAEDFRLFAEKNKDLFAANPNLRMGWDTTGIKPEINIGVSSDNLEAIKDVAARLDQRSVWDTQESKEIPIGGKGERTTFEEFPIEQRLKEVEPIEEISPKLSTSEKMVERWGTTDDPLNTAFILPDGRKVPLAGGWEHDSMINAAEGKLGGYGPPRREDFIETEKAIRTRYRPMTRGGQEVVFSVPSSGVTEQQILQMKQVVQKMGRTGTVVMEVGNRMLAAVFNTEKDFASAADIEPMLRKINAHPEQHESISPKLAGSTVPLMRKPLAVRGTGELGRITTVDIAKELNRYTRKSIGVLEQAEKTEPKMVSRGAKLAEEEAKYQLAQNSTGEKWYTDDIAVHDRIVTELRPELADPAKMSLFKAVIAITSSGAKPYQNLKTALKAWNEYQKRGEFPPIQPETGKAWGPRKVESYGMALDSLNKLITEKGEAGASQWLLEDHPISELRLYMNPRQTPVAGKATDIVPGALILGAKRGPFTLNLHGREAEFTADRWVVRTWNRWMGTIDVERMERDPQGGGSSPRSESERLLMKQSFEVAAKKLGKTTSQLQAILWFYEQALYSRHGVPKESWSFADAARRVQEESRQRPIPFTEFMEALKQAPKPE